jgi:tripartite-type tricarboxylate transporter receptor subunit TctC
MIVPYTPGGVTDVVARVLAKIVEPDLGQPVIIENKPGANGTLGAIQMINTQPDGYLLSIVPVGIFRQPHVEKMTLDPIKHLTYISSLVDYSYIVAVKGDSKWKTIDEFVKDARAKPDYSYGTPGAFSTPHLSMEELGRAGDLKWMHIPYKGASEIVPALLSGQVDIIAGTGSSTLDSFVKKGQIRILATLSDQRAADYPDVPTLKEKGFPIVANAPFGVVGPAGMDKKLVAKLDQAFHKALQSKQFRDMAKQNGVIVKYMGAADYDAYAKKTAALEKERMGRLITASGAK